MILYNSFFIPYSIVIYQIHFGFPFNFTIKTVSLFRIQSIIIQTTTAGSYEKLMGLML